MLFSQFPLDSRLIRGLESMQYLECTPVQEATLKAVLEHGKDVYAQSQTGTGKTAAFLVAAFWHLLKPEHDQKIALILAPTRELVVQIEKEAQRIAQNLSFNVISLYGGASYDRQLAALKNRPRIVVATPGRLLDFAEKKAIALKDVGVLVIDEADRLFDMGFHQDLLKIVKMMPPASQRLNLLFSATLNNKVGQLAWEHMNNPESIVIKAQYPTVEGIEQRLFHVGRSEKMVLLLAILKKEAPKSVIIFSNTKTGAGYISKRLQAAGYHCALLEGNIPQKKRLQIINNMKAGKINFLAATDVASRGLHIPDLSLVINFDLPDDAENYVHRIGRTARGTQTTGKAISFACERFVYNLSSIETLIKKKIPVALIDEELQKVVQEVMQEEAARPSVTGHSEHKPKSSHHDRPHRDHERTRKDHQRSDRSQSGRNKSAQGSRNASNKVEAGTAQGKPRHSAAHRQKPNSRPHQKPDHAPDRHSEPRSASHNSRHSTNQEPNAQAKAHNRPDSRRSASSGQANRSSSHSSSRSHATSQQASKPAAASQSKPTKPSQPATKATTPPANQKPSGVFTFLNKFFKKGD